MTDESRRALIEAYQRWQPESGITADQIANQYGVTRSSMYTLLRREGIPLKTGRNQRPVNQEPLLGDMGRVAVELMLDKIDMLNQRVRELEAQLAAKNGHQ